MSKEAQNILKEFISQLASDPKKIEELRRFYQTSRDIPGGKKAMVGCATLLGGVVAGAVSGWHPAYTASGAAVGGLTTQFLGDRWMAKNAFDNIGQADFMNVSARL